MKIQNTHYIDVDGQKKKHLTAPFSNAHEMNIKFFNVLNSILSRKGRAKQAQSAQNQENTLSIEEIPITDEKTALQRGYFGNGNLDSFIGEELIANRYANEVTE